MLVHSIATVLSAIAPPEHGDALAAVSTLPLVAPALNWWCLTVLTEMRNNRGKQKMILLSKRASAPWALPPRLNRPCSRPCRHRATLSADTRGCLDIVAELDNEAVSRSSAHQNGRYSLGSRHTSEPQTHIGHWNSDTGGSRRPPNLEREASFDENVKHPISDFRHNGPHLLILSRNVCGSERRNHVSYENFVYGQSHQMRLNLSSPTALVFI